MDNNIVVFEPNVPVVVKLKFPDGMLVAGRGNVPRVMYSLEDGRRMFLDKPVADSIKMCAFSPGQAFTICKRVNGKTTRWDIDAFQQPHTITEPVPAVSPQPDRGNGFHALPAPAPAVPRAAPPQKIPANVAFGEIVAFIKQELQYRGEQWNDEARQAAVCTMFIEAGKQGWLAPWERGK